MSDDPRTVCVFLSSSDGAAQELHDLAHELGTAIGKQGWTLLYGGTPTGTMGTLAEAARAAGAQITGVALQTFVDQGIHDTDADELLIAPTLGQRKDIMLARSDAFVGLPGGFGTLDEVVEVISQRQIGLHDKPMLLVDHEGYLQPLLAFFEILRARGLAYESTLGSYQAVESVETAVTTIRHHFADGVR